MDNKSISWFGKLRYMWYSINRKWNVDGNSKFVLLDRAVLRYREQDVTKRIFRAKRDITKSSMEIAKQILGHKPCKEGKNIESEEWFRCLQKVCKLICKCKCSNGHKLCIEIICIEVVANKNRTPQCKLLTPAFIESLLLSCYLYEKGELPLFNTEL